MNFMLLLSQRLVQPPSSLQAGIRLYQTLKQNDAKNKKGPAEMRGLRGLCCGAFDNALRLEPPQG
jgi:hypothetical protein